MPEAVTAVLAVRDEEAYLANCLRHLVRNGVAFAIIDHDSTDATSSICMRAEFAHGLVDLVRLPFRGTFSLDEQLEAKMRLVARLDTDWVIHLDADEIMHSYRAGETLAAALRRLGASGWNAVDFDEFVFVPVDCDYVADAPGPQPLRRYYYFRPFAPRLMRAWRTSADLSPVEDGGHMLRGPDLRLAPERLALRHYVVRSQQHAFEKYAARAFDPGELARGWHRARAGQARDAFSLPPASILKTLDDPAAADLDRGDPWTEHWWLRQARFPSGPTARE